MRIFLVRHGQSLGNVDQSVHKKMADHAIPLSELGRQQAREAGEALASYLFPKGFIATALAPKFRVWASPYKRTQQTADGFLEGFPDVLVRDRREHILLCEQQFGLFDGLTDEELRERYPEEHAHYAKCQDFEGRFWARMPLGESRFDVAQRVHQAFGTFHRDRDKHGIQDLIVVAHGTTLRAFVMMWCHKPVEWFEAEPNPPNCSIRLIEGATDRGYIWGTHPKLRGLP
jgi:2,3-bisphosphoglycerate-dependent phosphoglycerate mutase